MQLNPYLSENALRALDSILEDAPLLERLRAAKVHFCKPPEAIWPPNLLPLRDEFINLEIEKNLKLAADRCRTLIYEILTNS